MKKTKGQLTKESILEVAVMLVNRDGFNNVSFQKIANEINLSQAAIIKHYPSREILFDAIRTWVRESNQDWIQKKSKTCKTGKDQLFQYAFQSANWAIKHPSYAQIYILSYYFSAQDMSMRKRNTNIWKAADEKILKMLLLANEDSKIKSTQSFEALAEQIHFWVTGMAIRCFVGNYSSLQMKNLKNEIKEFIDHLL